LNTGSQRGEFRFSLRLVYQAKPVGRYRDRPLGDDAFRVRQALSQTGPMPVFRTADELRAKRISLDIAEYGQIMFVLLDRKGLEPPLPDMAAAAVMTVITTHMGRQQPLHPTAEIAVVVRPKDQMEMVGHQAITEQPHRQSLGCLDEQLNESGVVRVFMKDFRAGVAAIEDVVTPAA